MRAMILAYDFPPYVSVGGLRPHSWYRHFREFGIEPVVVTRQWSNVHGNADDYIAPSESDKTIVEHTEHGTVIRTPYQPTLSHRMLAKRGKAYLTVVRKAITAWHEVSQFFWFVGPKRHVYFGAREYLIQNSVDVIIATGEPFILFHYASALSREFKIPWVADYRDPWTQDKRRIGKRVSVGFDAYLEKRSVASASAITTVSDYFEKKIRTLVPRKLFGIIPNGYDPQNMTGAASEPQGSDRFTITFVGSVYAWHPVHQFFRCCQSFVESDANARFEIQFIGVNIWSDLERMLLIEYPALAPHVTFHDAIPNDQIASHLARSNVFLAFNNYANVGTKIYDYLAMKRVVLLCFSDDEESTRLKSLHYNLENDTLSDERPLEQIVNRTASGIVVKNASHLEQVLLLLYQEFLDKGSIECQSHGIDEFSRRNQAENLATFLKQIVDTGSKV